MHHCSSTVASVLPPSGRAVTAQLHDQSKVAEASVLALPPPSSRRRRQRQSRRRVQGRTAALRSPRKLTATCLTTPQAAEGAPRTPERGVRRWPAPKAPHSCAPLCATAIVRCAEPVEAAQPPAAGQRRELSHPAPAVGIDQHGLVPRNACKQT